MNARTQDKVVVITGGASGIGESMVRRFRAERARAVLADVDPDNGHRVSDEADAEFFQKILLLKRIGSIRRHTLAGSTKVTTLSRKHGLEGCSVGVLRIGERTLICWGNID